MERSMRQYVEQTGEKLPEWKYKPAGRPTSFMMTKKFMGIKIGKERRLSKPLNFDRKAFLLVPGSSRNPVRRARKLKKCPKK
jgi:hypothetical protein